MKIAVRVDASHQMGTGHFMRCLALADGLARRGGQIRFISRQLPEHLKDMLAPKGHQLRPLSSGSVEASSGDLAHSHWLGTNQHIDSQETIEALADQDFDWLIVDHYALDARWESALRQSTRNILVIDDLADRTHDCDVLLDQNCYLEQDTRYKGRVPAHCRLLLGPRYALLRDEFRQLHLQVKPRSGPVKRVLVFVGGIDAKNLTICAIDALDAIGSGELSVDVVIGKEHPHLEQIISACAAHRFQVHIQTTGMADLMAAADLAIGAGGTATWERCCLGLPTFSIATAHNQMRQVADAAAAGLLYAPEPAGTAPDVLGRHLSTLIENPYLRRLISCNAMEAVDGRGISRVIGNLGCTNIQIRLASQKDSKQLFEWRNHPTIRSVSRNSQVISWEDHQRWLASMLTDSAKLLLIGHRDAVPLGVVRFDIVDQQAEISIYLVPGIDEPGLGRELLQAAENWVAANRLSIRKIRAYVLGSNVRSQRLFLGSGYDVESTFYFKNLH